MGTFARPTDDHSLWVKDKPIEDRQWLSYHTSSPPDTKLTIEGELEPLSPLFLLGNGTEKANDLFLPRGGSH